MTPYQQLVLYNPESVTKTALFNCYEDYAKWLTTRQSG